MIIVRAPRRSQYEIVPHELLMDQRLSYRARGVAVRLLANMDGFQMAAADIARQSPREGRAAVQKALRELRENGYVRVERKQDSRGRWTTTMTISDVPSSTTTEARFSGFGNPSSGQPVSGLPEIGTPNIGGVGHRSSIPSTNTKTTTVCSGIEDGLEFPPGLIENAPEIIKALTGLGVQLQQKLLDELSGALMSSNPPRRPLAWLRAVANRARQGEFTPDQGLAVDAERRRRVTFAKNSSARKEAAAAAAARMRDPESRARGIQAMRAALAELKPDRSEK